MTSKTMMMKKRSSKRTIPEAARKELLRLQLKYRALLSMMPRGPNELYDLDAADFNDKLIDMEMIANAMTEVCNQQLAVFTALDDE
jgi:hypothetical protein